jgi:hypothetical protein
LLDQLKGAKYFTKTDLTAGYHQVCMASPDTWKTTFKTRFGLYEWMVIPFGLTNTPATFQRLINDIFRPLLGRIVVIYLDDILVFRKTWEEHLQHVRSVLQLLCTNHLQLQVKERKSSFGHTFVSYLRFFIDQGVCPDASKVQALA